LLPRDGGDEMDAFQLVNDEGGKKISSPGEVQKVPRSQLIIRSS